MKYTGKIKFTFDSDREKMEHIAYVLTLTIAHEVRGKEITQQLFNQLVETVADWAY